MNPPVFFAFLCLALQGIWIYLWGAVGYFCLLTFFNTLFFLVQKLGWGKKYAFLERLTLVLVLLFGNTIPQFWAEKHQQQKKTVYFWVSLLAWNLLIFAFAPIWAWAVHFPILLVCLAAHLNFRVYYYLAYFPSVSFDNWLSQPSPFRQKAFIWVVRDLFKQEHPYAAYLLSNFAEKYTSQYPLPTQYSPQTQALEDFIWEFLAQPNLPTLPKSTVISLLARQVGLSDLHQKLPTAAAREAVSIKQGRGILKSDYTMILSPKMIAHIRKIDDLFVDLNKSNYHAYLPPLIIKMLVLDEIWMRSLAAHHSNSPVVKELFVYIIEEWGNIATDFFNRPKLYPDYDWFFNRLSLSQLIETYTNDLLPLLEKDPELAEKFTYTCNMSLLGSEIAKNLH